MPEATYSASTMGCFDKLSMTCVDTILDKLGVTYVDSSKQSLIPSSLQTGFAIEGSCCLSMHPSFLVSSP